MNAQISVNSKMDDLFMDCLICGMSLEARNRFGVINEGDDQITIENRGLQDPNETHLTKQNNM